MWSIEVGVVCGKYVEKDPPIPNSRSAPDVVVPSGLGAMQNCDIMALLDDVTKSDHVEQILVAYKFSTISGCTAG